MTTAVSDFLHSFDSLPESDKRELAAEIIRRFLKLDLPAFTDGEYTRIADDMFLALDREEATDAKS